MYVNYALLDFYLCQFSQTILCNTISPCKIDGYKSMSKDNKRDKKSIFKSKTKKKLKKISTSHQKRNFLNQK